MRVLLMFDLPVETAQERHDYSRFHRDLINDGFLMMQKSVYCKLVLSMPTAKAVRDRVNKYKPPKGLIQLLIVTEKQYADMEYLLGEAQTCQIDSTERLVIL